MVGDFDMPLVYAQDVQLESINLIGFDHVKSEESDSNKAKTVHLFS